MDSKALFYAPLKDKEIARSKECSPNAYCLQKADLVIQHHL